LKDKRKRSAKKNQKELVAVALPKNGTAIALGPAYTKNRGKILMIGPA